MQHELGVMREVAQLLEPLDPTARSRIVGWVIGALNIQGVPRPDGGLTASKSTGTVRAACPTTNASPAVAEWIDEEDYSVT